jgi:hypothetical protein
MIENRKIIIEHIMSVGLNTARQVISGIMQRWMIMPGIIPQITEAIAVTTYITCFATLFLSTNKRILKMIIANETAITAKFAL